MFERSEFNSIIKLRPSLLSVACRVTGNTEDAEKEALRGYFSQEDLPEELQEIDPLFWFMDDEATARAS